VRRARSGPGAARTILLFHTISARPSKQPPMVGSTLVVYSFGLIFVSARTNKRHHHLMTPLSFPTAPTTNLGFGWEVLADAGWGWSWGVRTGPGLLGMRGGVCAVALLPLNEQTVY